ncbi:GDSL-like Lipase/Acylhydrolase family protein [Lutibacter agarilyticus]|uniref:GDSL-like Lipase/Acylhydrolase family protein n=1 Tax=Lutibacter agarilyticus TaxID=1109740 RepID=A0A238WRC9_9FLAO|nr:SGNH/GDSL hydrolase family protein [Lutibacter agarilyticus]SNR48209.1 GDSL-like Lipase/Acylhydrolase family protein [Lutibacter agarilyticus]
MNAKIARLLFVLFLACFVGCKKKQNKVLNAIKAESKLFYYQGRTDVLNDSTVALISPGAYVVSTFLGNSCEVFLKGEFEPYNYVSLELDGKYLGRIKIESDSIRPYLINVSTTNKEHTLKIFKETEASNGTVLFSGLKAEKVVPYKLTTTNYIEFIGNSITCGAASDGSVIPCESAAYFDHQNVYYAYGPTVSRALNIDFKLSSVSGYGIYRNWNDENIEEPNLPQVYENLYLNTDNSKKNNFDHIPDVVSICLGTNDLSVGDGVKPRLPFNKEKFISNYIKFVKTVYIYYPKTQIVLLNSPMVGGEMNELLATCLEEVQFYFSENMKKQILLFIFDAVYNGGCLGHPSVSEHQKIAEKLTPFLKNIKNN